MTWQHISPQVIEGFYEVLYIQCSTTDGDMLCTGCEDGDSDTDW